MRDVQQIVPRQLRRRVPVQRGLHLFRSHPAAVIRHADHAFSPVANIDRNPVRPGVDRVFHQLLHGRGRSLDDLARRDLVNQRFW